MDKRAQWKALRAPVIQSMWDNRKSPTDDMWGYRPHGMIAKPGSHSKEACEEYWLRGRRVLVAMRAAERAGMDPLIWKLTHGGKQ